MNDGINEVGKTLRGIKKNSEAALRRHTLAQPKIERTRDIFDDIVPFEMMFDTEGSDTEVRLDLYFNKPPPMRMCKGGRFAMPCERFVLGPGDHLIQVTARYIAGSVSAFRDNVELSPSEYSEYDPTKGLVLLQGTPTSIEFSVCYTRDTWVPCPPSYTSNTFSSSGPLLIPSLPNNFVQTYGGGGSAYAETGPNVPHNDLDFAIWSLLPDLPGGFTFPSNENVFVSHTISLTGDGFVGFAKAFIGGGLTEALWKVQVGSNADYDSQTGFYVNQNGTYRKMGDETTLTVTIDRNVARGTTILSTADITLEFPAVTNSYPTTVTFSFSTFGSDQMQGSASAYLTAFSIGCSLQAGF